MAWLVWSYNTIHWFTIRNTQLRLLKVLDDARRVPVSAVHGPWSCVQEKSGASSAILGRVGLERARKASQSAVSHIFPIFEAENHNIVNLWRMFWRLYRLQNLLVSLSSLKLFSCNIYDRVDLRSHKNALQAFKLLICLTRKREDTQHQLKHNC